MGSSGLKALGHCNSHSLNCLVVKKYLVEQKSKNKIKHTKFPFINGKGLETQTHILRPPHLPPLPSPSLPGDSVNMSWSVGPPS